MDKAIYMASDGSIMSKIDLTDWLSIFKNIHPEFADWNFDDITGGTDSFLDNDEYCEVKVFYENNIVC